MSKVIKGYVKYKFVNEDGSIEFHDVQEPQAPPESPSTPKEYSKESDAATIDRLSKTAKWYKHQDMLQHLSNKKKAEHMNAVREDPNIERDTAVMDYYYSKKKHGWTANKTAEELEKNWEDVISILYKPIKKRAILNIFEKHTT